MPMYTRYSDLYPLLVPELPGLDAGDPNNAGARLLLQSLQKAGREYCLASGAWIEDLAAIDLTEDEDEYTLTPGYDAHIQRVVELRIKTEQDITDGKRGTVQNDRYYWYIPPSTLRLDTTLIPDADLADGMVVRVVYVPYLGTDADFPAEFLDRHATGIIAWALADLQSMPDKKWTDLKRAGQNMATFNKEVNAAKGFTATQGTDRPAACEG